MFLLEEAAKPKRDHRNEGVVRETARHPTNHSELNGFLGFHKMFPFGVAEDPTRFLEVKTRTTVYR